MMQLIDRTQVVVQLRASAAHPGISVPCFIDPRAAPDPQTAVFHQMLLAIAGMGDRMARLEHAVIAIAGEPTAIDAAMGVVEHPALASLRESVSAMRAAMAAAEAAIADQAPKVD